jgi:hypothetical protein
MSPGPAAEPRRSAARKTSRRVVSSVSCATGFGTYPTTPNRGRCGRSPHSSSFRTTTAWQGAKGSASSARSIAYPSPTADPPASRSVLRRCQRGTASITPLAISASTRSGTSVRDGAAGSSAPPGETTR